MEDYLIPLKTPCVYYDPTFLPPTDANEAFDDLLQNTPWEISPKINRWVTLMELHPNNDNNNDAYKYRDAPGKAIQGFPPTIMKLKAAAEQWYNSKQKGSGSDYESTPVSFNICLLNYYPTSQHRLGWHSDREELGRSTPIASISLGCTRSFLVRSKTDGMNDRASIKMEHGSMVVMENICQLRYLHSVPKEDSVDGKEEDNRGRINVTFRCKDYSMGATAGELEHERRDQWIDGIQTESGDADVMACGWKITMDASEKELGGVVFGDDIRYYDEGLHAELKVEYLIRTNIGAECYCAAELEEVMDIERYTMLSRPFGVAGYVAVCKNSDDDTDDGEDESQVLDALLQLRTAHHILRYHDHFDLDDVLGFMREKDGAADLTKASLDGEMLYQYYKDRLVSKEGCVQTLADLESGTFRVSSERIGNHGFQAPEVER
jgi:alkylated DNA repair dioxygenase AlkB